MKSLGNLYLSISDTVFPQRTAEAVRASHKLFLLLERRATSWDDSASLRKDIIFLDSVAVRIIFEFYALDRYDAESTAGRKSLMALLWTLPDNKIVEDIHQPLRLNARGNVNRKLSYRNIQSTIEESRVLETRDIPNPCRITKDIWVKQFFRTKVAASTKSHEAERHKLPAPWSRMMKPNKTWHTLNEDTLQRAAAAWVWLHAYADMRGQGLHVSVDAAIMSKLVPPCVVLRHL